MNQMIEALVLHPSLPTLHAKEVRKSMARVLFKDFEYLLVGFLFQPIQQLVQATHKLFVLALTSNFAFITSNLSIGARNGTRKLTEIEGYHISFSPKPTVLGLGHQFF